MFFLLFIQLSMSPPPAPSGELQFFLKYIYFKLNHYCVALIDAA